MKLTSIAFCISLLGLVLSCSWAQTTYTLSPIGTPGVTNFTPIAINNRGQIVGFQGPQNGESAVLFQNGSLTILPNVAGFSSSRAKDINDSGQIVGTSYKPSGATTGFIYSNGALNDFGNASYTSGINNSGQVVGAARAHGFLYSNGILTDIGALKTSRPEDDVSTAMGVNESGVIVGVSLFEGQFVPFIYSDGAMARFELPPSFPQGPSNYMQINNDGSIAGDTGRHAFAQIDDQAVDLHLLLTFPTGPTVISSNSSAVAINNFDLVVGNATAVRSGNIVNKYAFYYSLADGIHLLDDLFDLSDGTFPGFTSLNTAFDINDLGQIIGVGTYFDGTSSFSAPFIIQVQTIPEPSTCALLTSLAIFSLFLRRQPQRC